MVSLYRAAIIMTDNEGVNKGSPNTSIQSSWCSENPFNDFSQHPQDWEGLQKFLKYMSV